MRLWLLLCLALTACVSTTPPRPPTTEQAAGSLTSTRSPRELLERSGDSAWMVPDANGNPICVPMSHERWNSRDHEGRLAPRVPRFAYADGSGFFNLENRPEDPNVRAPYRRTEMYYRVERDQLVLHSPRGLMHLSRALLSECSTATPLRDAPMFESVAACEAELGHRAPQEFGDCAPNVPAFPFDDRAPRRFERVMRRGGRFYRIERTQAGVQCVRWRVNATRGEMSAVHPTRDGYRIRTTYRIGYGGHVLAISGVGVDFVGRRPPDGEIGTLGCADDLYVRQLDPEGVTVAGSRWYFDRARCEESRDRGRPPAVAICHAHRVSRL